MGPDWKRVWCSRMGPVLKRLLQSALVLFALSVVVFYISRLAPGDPLRSYYGEGVERMSTLEREAAMERLGLSRPIHEQYIAWFQGALNGDFGISFKYKRDVTEVIGGMAGNTALLGGISYLLTLSLALLLGAWCALHEGGTADRLLARIGTIVSAIPEFWLSLLLILFFSVVLGWLPSGGAYGIGQAGSLLSRLSHLILPVAVLLAGHLWYFAYLIRERLLEEARREYVLFCRAQGLSRRRTLFRHCLPNALPSYIGLAAVSVPHILGGTYVVEKVFSYPGLGTLCFESAKYHDYNMLMVLCLLTGGLVLAANLLGDLLNGWLDPRMKREGRAPDAL